MKVLAAFLMLALSAASAQAQDFYVDITNRSGYTIYWIYVSEAHNDSWEEDVMGDDVLMDGDTQRVNLYGYKKPLFDIKLKDEDGYCAYYWDVDVSTDDITARKRDFERCD